MNWWSALLVTLGLLVLGILVTMMTGMRAMWVIVVGSALWASIDSWRIGLKRYKSGVSTGPVLLFIGVALLWIIGLPWYLIIRGKIKNGTAMLKPEYSAARADV